MSAYTQTTDPIDEGYTAYQLGQGRDENPYELGSIENDLWDEGWEEAFYEDDKEF